MSGAVMRAGQVQTRTAAEILEGLHDSYSSATAVFLHFLEDSGHGIDAEGIRAFSAFLREEHNGVRLQARTVNFYLSAVKSRVRYPCSFPRWTSRPRLACSSVSGS